MQNSKKTSSITIKNVCINTLFHLAILPLAGCHTTTSNMNTKLIVNQENESTTPLHNNLYTHVSHLAEKIGIRNIENNDNYKKLKGATDYIKKTLIEIGYTPNIYKYTATYNGEEFEVENIEVVVQGSNPFCPYIVIGAHYDTVAISPGADDNASSVACLLELARSLYSLDKGLINTPIKIVFFPNEEAPYSLDQKTRKSFGNNMGSVVYAKRAKEKGDVIEGMICLESIGYFSDIPNSQRYPFLLGWLKYLYSDKGNFLFAVSNISSRKFLKKCIASYRNQTTESRFCISRAILPQFIRDIGRSDHKSFWLQDYPAFMITDTAGFRNANYHKKTDTIDTVNFPCLTKITEELGLMVKDLAIHKKPCS